MKKTHKILIPNMAPVQFRILAAAMEQAGYQCELLENCGSEVSELGLKYVHNDTCYPALLVIGQMIDALQSGKYDLNKVALIITQTGGGCRASNYIHLLRKALEKAGMAESERPTGLEEVLSTGRTFIVSPRDSDRMVELTCMLLARALNRAFGVEL